MVISIHIAEIITKLKGKRETQDAFIRRVLAEWDDLKDYRLDMHQVVPIKDKQIRTLENELKQKVKSSF
jgi:hypothetical protein